MKETIIICIPAQDKENIKNLAEYRGITRSQFIRGVLEKKTRKNKSIDGERIDSKYSLMNTPQLAFQVSEAFHKEIKSAAKKENMSVTKYIITTIQEEFKEFGVEVDN